MPVGNWNLARMFGTYWLPIDHGEEPVRSHPLWGQVVNYGRTRANLLQAPWGDITWYRNFWNLVASAGGIQPSDTIVFLGAGFGYLAEAALDAGWASVQTVDDSNWIDAHKDELGWRWNGSAWVQDQKNMSDAVQAVWHKAALTSNPVALRNALGGRRDWVITDSMLSSLVSSADPFYTAGEEDGTELDTAFAGCDGLVQPTGTVLHLVTLNAKPPFHRRDSVASWKALHPAHAFAVNGPFPDFAIL